MNREPLPVETLVSSDARRLDIALEAILPMAASRHEEMMADPILDHLPASAPSHKVNRTLSILDQLERETINRRFAH